jgi:MFS family permease
MMQEVGSEILLDRACRKATGRILPLLFLSYLVAYLDRINISFAKLQMVTDIGLSDATYAIGASLFFWSYMVFEVPSNLLLKKVGARIWISRIMVSWGIVSVLMMFIIPIAAFFHTSQTTVFYALRLLLGACEAGFLPGVLYYLANWLPSNRQAKIFAMYLVSLPVSLMIGGPLSGWVLQISANSGLFRGWQWLFLIEGLPSIVMGIVVFIWLPRDIASSRWLSLEEKSCLTASLKKENVHKVESVAAAVRDGRVWMLILIILAMNTGFYGLSFWLPTIIHRAGVTNPLTIGFLTAIPWLASIPCLILNAAHSTRTGERRLHAAVPALIGGVAFVASALAGSHFYLSLACLTVATGGLLAAFPIYWTFPNQILSGTAAAAGLALINSIGALAGVFGSVTSAIAESVTGNINNGTYIFGALELLGGLLILALPRMMSGQRPSAEPEISTAASQKQV